jgi:hypothetical protein
LSTFTVEDVPPRSVGGRPLLLTCKRCNEFAGATLDWHWAHFSDVEGFAAGNLPEPVTVNFTYEGLRVVAELSNDGSGFVLKIIKRRQTLTLWERYRATSFGGVFDDGNKFPRAPRCAPSPPPALQGPSEYECSRPSRAAFLEHLPLLLRPLLGQRPLGNMAWRTCSRNAGAAANGPRWRDDHVAKRDPSRTADCSVSRHWNPSPPLGSVAIPNESEPAGPSTDQTVASTTFSITRTALGARIVTNGRRSDDNLGDDVEWDD